MIRYDATPSYSSPSVVNGFLPVIIVRCDCRESRRRWFFFQGMGQRAPENFYSTSAVASSVQARVHTIIIVTVFALPLYIAGFAHVKITKMYYSL